MSPKAETAPQAKMPPFPTGEPTDSHQVDKLDDYSYVNHEGTWFFAATLPVVGQNGFLPAKANLFLKNDVF